MENESNNKNLKRRIMARIYIEYTKNVFFDYPDYFMLALFVAASLGLVSIHNVIVNMPTNNLVALFNFFKIALLNTSIVIQILIAGFFVRVVASGAVFAYKNNIIPRLSFINRLMKLRYIRD